MEDTKPRTKQPWTLRKKALVITPIVITVIALVLGLSLGLTIGRDNSSDDDDGDDSASPPLSTPSSSPLWTPKPNDTWQIILQNKINLPKSADSVTPNVSIYDIDLFETPVETIDTLHQLGKKVLCYFSGGSYEPGRPDSEEFAEADLGKELDGWPGEKWVKLDSEGVRKIMKERVELAGKKKCDGIDVDNVDGFQNDNGLSLTANSSVDFMSYLSSLTTPLNISLGLKNAGDIITQVLPIVHFSVNEQCVEYKECSKFRKFIDAGKPVFHIEYPDSAGQKLREDVRSKYCGTNDEGKKGDTEGFSTVLKKMDLDGWVEYCDGTVEVTEVSGSGGKE